jgi:lipid A 3-O-deacylase
MRGQPKPSRQWLLLALPLVALALERAPAQARSTIRFEVENDYLDFARPPRERPDGEYTHGMRITYLSTSTPPRVARPLEAMAAWAVGSRDVGATPWSIVLGQEIYTPSVVTVPWLLPDDRPYAGWLFASAKVRAVTPRDMGSAALTVGVTGPPSLAERAQLGFHRWLPFHARPAGWIHQLHFEPAFAVLLDRARLVARLGGADHAVADVAVHGGASLGTVRTAIDAGIRLRAGMNLTHPWLPDQATSSRFQAFAFAGARAAAVGRNLFLDGNTFRDSHRVNREAVVPALEYGLAIRRGSIGVTYRMVVQGREHDHGPARHPYGALGVELGRSPWMH